MTAAHEIEGLILPTLVLQLDESTLTVTINQPDSLNALSPAVITDLRRVFAPLHERLGGTEHSEGADWSIRSVILTGSGDRAFVAGADIRALSDMSADEVRSYASEVHELFGWVETLPVPVIAVVNGYALGGGLELALACDMIYCTEKSKFGFPEVGLGIIPGFGGCVRLPRVVGPAIANELIFTGRHVSAAEAQRIGIASRVTENAEDVRSAALETLAQAEKNSPAAVAEAKRTLSAVRSLGIEDGVAVELDAFAGRFGSPDMIEGTSAFTEKRAPRFQGL